MRGGATATTAGKDPPLGGDYGAAAVLFVAGILARLDGPVLWCLARCDLFAPALAAVGLHPDRVVYAQAVREADLLAIMEDGLRTPGLAAVVGEAARLSLTASRRLQLAAEASGVTAFVIRRPRPGKEPRTEGTAALTRWRIAAVPSDLASASSGVRGELSPSPFQGEGLSTRLPSLTSSGPGGGSAPPRADAGGFCEARDRHPGRSSAHALRRAGIQEHPGREVFEDSCSWIPDRRRDHHVVRGASGMTSTYGFSPRSPRGGREERSPLGCPTHPAAFGRGRWHVALLRLRGGEPRSFLLEACDATGRLALPAELADGSALPALRSAVR